MRFSRSRAENCQRLRPQHCGWPGLLTCRSSVRGKSRSRWPAGSSAWRPPAQWFQGLAERYDLPEVPLEAAVACAAAALPPVHRDPFDRVIVALARAHALTVLTSDENIPRYPGVTTLW
ncbi:MAG: PIN domain-containing protein [Vicinamibacterales bacterium]